MKPPGTEEEIAARMLADFKETKARGFSGWRIICPNGTGLDGERYDRATDHLVNQKVDFGPYRPRPEEKLGAWAPILDEDGNPIVCPVCGAPLERTPLPA